MGVSESPFHKIESDINRLMTHFFYEPRRTLAAFLFGGEQGVAFVALLILVSLCVVVQPLVILRLNEFAAGLIEAQVQSLVVQGEIIAGAIAGSATVETDAIIIDPDRLLELQAGESYRPSDDPQFGYEFPVNPERVAPLLRRLITPTKTRARIYDRDGTLILDSRSLYGRGDVLRFDLPPPTTEKPGIMERVAIFVRNTLARGDRPLYHDLGGENGTGYPEVNKSLNGQKVSMVRVTDRGEVIVLVAMPIQRFRAVRGALLLSTQGADIDQTVATERLSLLKTLPLPILTGLLGFWLAFQQRQNKQELLRERAALARQSQNDKRYLSWLRRLAIFLRHEVRNPVAQINSSIEIAQLECRSDNRVMPHLMSAASSSQQVWNLIERASQATDAEAFVRQCQRRWTDLRLLVDEQLRAFRKTHSEIYFELHSSSTLGYVDPTLIKQAVDNLLSNAASFANDGSTIDVELSVSESNAIIKVINKGPPIEGDPEVLFGPFASTRSGPSSEHQGLGLYLVRLIAEQHGGTVRLFNLADGSGVVATMSLSLEAMKSPSSDSRGRARI